MIEQEEVGNVEESGRELAAVGAPPPAALDGLRADEIKAGDSL